EDRGDGGGAGAVRALDADAADHVHDHALRGVAGVRAVTITDATLTAALLVLARVAGLVLAAPLFGHPSVPLRVRAGFAAVLALALVPPVLAATPPPAAPATLWELA